ADDQRHQLDRTEQTDGQGRLRQRVDLDGRRDHRELRPDERERLTRVEQAELPGPSERTDVDEQLACPPPGCHDASIAPQARTRFTPLPPSTRSTTRPTHSSASMAWRTSESSTRAYARSPSGRSQTPSAQAGEPSRS